METAEVAYEKHTHQCSLPQTQSSCETYLHAVVFHDPTEILHSTRKKARPGTKTIFSDSRIPIQGQLFGSPLISALATLTLWGLAHSLPPLIILSLLYGFFGGGYVVLWARIGTFLDDDDPTIALTTFGVFAFLKGVGNVLAGPISSLLITQAATARQYAIGRYKGVVIYTGVCMFVSSLAMVVWYIRRIIPKRILRCLAVWRCPA